MFVVFSALLLYWCVRSAAVSRRSATTTNTRSSSDRRLLLPEPIDNIFTRETGAVKINEEKSGQPAVRRPRANCNPETGNARLWRSTASRQCKQATVKVSWIILLYPSPSDCADYSVLYKHLICKQYRRAAKRAGMYVIERLGTYRDLHGTSIAFSGARCLTHCPAQGNLKEQVVDFPAAAGYHQIT